MSRNKHSYVAFHMDRWAGGTARMTRLIKSVYFDVCFHNWDKCEAVSEAELMLILADLEGQGERIVDLLVGSGKLIRNSDGSVYNETAIDEGTKALDLFTRKSGGGKKGAAATNASNSDGKTPADTPVAEKIRLDKTPTEEEDSGESSFVIEPEKSGDHDADEDDRGKPAPVKTYAVQPVIDAWNAMAKASGLAPVKKISEKRRNGIRARLHENTEAELIEAISLVPHRPFCMGQNDRNWKAHFDWFLYPNTATVLREGTKYMSSTGGWQDA